MTHRIVAAALSIGVAASIGAAIALAPATEAQDHHRQPGVERCVRVQIWPDPPPFAGVMPSRLQAVCEYAVLHKFNPPPPPFPFLQDLR